MPTEYTIKNNKYNTIELNQLLHETDLFTNTFETDHYVCFDKPLKSLEYDIIRQKQIKEFYDENVNISKTIFRLFLLLIIICIIGMSWDIYSSGEQ